MMFLHSIVLYCFTIWLLKVEKHVIQLIFKKTIFETYISLFIIDILDNFFLSVFVLFVRFSIFPRLLQMNLLNKGLIVGMALHHQRAVSQR